MNEKKFNEVVELVKKLADQGKFNRRETNYSKPFGGIDEGVAFVAEFEGSEYTIEQYVSDPEPMDIIQQRIIYYNLEVRSRGRTLELDEDEFDEEREKLYRYVVKRTRPSKVIKSHKTLFDRMGIPNSEELSLAVNEGRKLVKEFVDSVDRYPSKK